MFATINEKEFISTPYMSHNINPVQFIMHIRYEISPGDLVLIILLIWGTDENVVQTAANNPIISSEFIM